MKRDTKQFAGREFDLLVVGAGIYGAALAREAALRGLSVAVADKGDFCSATSANSLKIIHGGLRYLQQADVPRLRESVRERRCLLATAPHLVQPLPCALPTRGFAMRSRAAMTLGLFVNDCLSWDRNRGLSAEQRIPAGRLVSRPDWLRIAPDLTDPRFTGAALWHDAIAYNTERLALGMIGSAAHAGAAVANYLEVVEFQRRDRDVTGAVAVDRVTGQTVRINARATAICTGPWTRETLTRLDGSATCPDFRLALGVNVILRRSLVADRAVGLMSRPQGWKGGRLLFFVPWRGRTMVGTYYRIHDGSPDAPVVTGDDLAAFLADINSAYPGANLAPGDVAMIHAGLLPAGPRPSRSGEPDLLNHYRIVDHGESDGTTGLFTVIGVKYTTARDVAERAIQRMAPAFGKPLPPGRSRAEPLPGGDIRSLADAVREAGQAGLDTETAARVVRLYGSDWPSLLQLGREDTRLMAPVSGESRVIGAEILRATREEMACTLADAVLRRTDLASAGLPEAPALATSAAIMARELGWDAARVESEIQAVRALRNWPGA